MTTLAFVVWMIGWPIGCSIASSYAKQVGKTYSEDAQVFSAFIDLILWVVIAMLLWENR